MFPGIIPPSCKIKMIAFFYIMIFLERKKKLELFFKYVSFLRKREGTVIVSLITFLLFLFAGSGQMGIEALSRGAASVVFVDRSARSLQVTRENLESVQFAEQAQLHQTEAQSFLQSTAMQFDIAILDPPYRKGMHEKLLPLLAEHMADNGIVICEHETGLEMPQSVGVLEQKKQKKYGAITVTTYICRRD